MANTILPPRYDVRASADAAALPAFPIYEESSGSLRPTWLPIDPSSYPPPTLRSREPRGSRFVKGAQIAGLLLATWVVAFGSVIGSHVVRERFAKRAAAASVSATADVLPMPVTAVTAVTAVTGVTGVMDAVMPAAPFQAENVNSGTTKTADSGVTLTVDVNSLPISRDLPRARKSKAGRGQSAGS